MERHDRFGGVLFCNDKANDENSPGNGQENNRRGSPWIDAPAKGGEQDQAAGRGSQQNSTQVVNCVLTSLACGGQGNGDHEQGEGTNGEIDVENPTPGEGIDKKASKKGSGNA